MDGDCSIVPKGAYVVTPTHYLVPNPSFAGLSATEASDASNFLHFRRPEAAERQSAMDREGAVKDTDFLDPVSEDEPRGVWSIRLEASEGVATVRSLRWPGFYFAHRLGTTSFAGAYFGDGVINRDLAFMA
jgi:radial spoke head protein 9